MAADDRLWLLFFLALALALRLWQLDARPYHHDESIHAWFAWQLWQEGEYRFDPVFHGPLLYWSNALVYLLSGASDFTARLLPALASVSLVVPLWLLRAQLGTAGWKGAAVFLALSPTMNYYGRFLGHDNYCALFTLVLVWLGISWYRQRQAWRAALAGVTVGLFVATKAVVYIQLGLFALFAVAVLALDSFAPRWPRARLLGQALATLRRCKWQLALCVLAMTVTYIAFYSAFFSDWNGVVRGVTGTLGYWGGQQADPRIPGPVYYYLPRLMLHEPVFWLALPALVWVARAPPRPFDMFLGFWTIAALAIYGFAQEKVPWLLIYMLLPMSLLAGRWLDNLWRCRTGYRLWRPLLRVALPALLLLWSARETLWLNFRMVPATPHLLTYMASTPAMKEVALSLRTLPPGSVYLAGRAAWPMAWYLRGTGAVIGLPEGWRENAIAVEADEKDHAMLQAAGFTARDYPLMTWWNPGVEFFGAAMIDSLRRREPSRATGEYRFYLFKKGEGDTGGDATAD